MSDQTYTHFYDGGYLQVNVQARNHDGMEANIHDLQKAIGDLVRCAGFWSEFYVEIKTKVQETEDDAT